MFTGDQILSVVLHAQCWLSRLSWHSLLEKKKVIKILVYLIKKFWYPHIGICLLAQATTNWSIVQLCKAICSCKKSYHSQPLGHNMTLPIGCLLTVQSICGLCLNPTCNIINFPDPPEIELETDRVHSGDNKEAHLTCLIHGNPAPTVRKLIITIHFFQVLHFCL